MEPPWPWLPHFLSPFSFLQFLSLQLATLIVFQKYFADAKFALFPRAVLAVSSCHSFARALMCWALFNQANPSRVFSFTWVAAELPWLGGSMAIIICAALILNTSRQLCGFRQDLPTMRKRTWSQGTRMWIGTQCRISEGPLSLQDPFIRNRHWIAGTNPWCFLSRVHLAEHISTAQWPRMPRVKCVCVIIYCHTGGGQSYHVLPTFWPQSSQSDIQAIVKRDGKWLTISNIFKLSLGLMSEIGPLYLQPWAVKRARKAFSSFQMERNLMKKKIFVWS